MPRIEEHQDGTKTFSINTSELDALRSLAQLVPDLDRVLDFLAAPGLRSALEFVRTLADDADDAEGADGAGSADGAGAAAPATAEAS